jgi:hypothetical protein
MEMNDSDANSTQDEKHSITDHTDIDPDQVEHSYMSTL